LEAEGEWIEAGEVGQLIDMAFAGEIVGGGG
jgi:hypothetical protein